jgi:hypothetical protein
MRSQAPWSALLFTEMSSDLCLAHSQPYLGVFSTSDGFIG